MPSTALPSENAVFILSQGSGDKLGKLHYNINGTIKYLISIFLSSDGFYSAYHFVGYSKVAHQVKYILKDFEYIQEDNTLNLDFIRNHF